MDFQYTVKYSKRKSLGIYATGGDSLEVRAPIGTPVSVIENALLNNKARLIKMLAHAQKKHEGSTYNEGDEFLYFGKNISIHYRELDELLWRLDEPGNKLYINSKYKNYADSVLRNFYERRATYLHNRCIDLADMHGFEITKISLRWTKSRWGSCSSRGSISLCIALIMAPREIQDYIILHELCHTRHPNHSADFYAELAKYDPLHKEHKRWLKENGYLLRVKPLIGE